MEAPTIKVTRIKSKEHVLFLSSLPLNTFYIFFYVVVFELFDFYVLWLWTGFGIWHGILERQLILNVLKIFFDLMMVKRGYVPGFETRVLNDLIYYVIFRKEKKHNILSLWIFRRHLKDFLGSRFEIYFVKNIHPVQNFGEQVGPNHNWLLGSEQYFINIWCFKLLFHCRFPHNVSHEISVCSSLIGFSVKGNKKIARIRNVFWNVLKSESGNAIL